jgi:hypothetical protein
MPTTTTKTGEMITKKWMMTAVAEFDFEVFAETPEDAKTICLENLDNGLFVAEEGKIYTAFYNSTELVNDPEEMELQENEYVEFREHRGEGNTTAVEKLLRKVDELERTAKRNATIISFFYNKVIHNFHKNGVDLDTIQNTLNETRVDYGILHNGVEGLEDILGDMEIIQVAKQFPHSFREYMEIV